MCYGDHTDGQHLKGIRGREISSVKQDKEERAETLKKYCGQGR